MTYLFSNAQVLTMAAAAGESAVFEGCVAVESNRIVLVTDDPERVQEYRRIHPDLREIDCRGGIVMPGLINTHCHVPMTLQRSYADDIGLMEWLNDYIWPFEAKQTDADIEAGAELGVAEMLLGGVTSFIDMYWSEASVFRAVDRMGMRALLCASYLDARPEAFDRDLPALLELTQGHSRISAGLAPHAGYTCSAESLRRGVAWCRRYGLRMTTHLAETRDESRMIGGRTGMSPTAYLDSLGVLGAELIAAHCVHLSDDDRRILSERGVQVAHCPSSNMKIASGIAPIERLRREGVCCTIGTDGTCSNNDLDLWEEMRNASFLQKVSTMDPCAVPAYEILRMATVNGARALGYGDELGVLREGALADLIVIDTHKPHLRPMHDPVANLVYCCKASDVDTVMVDGEIRVERGRLCRADVGELCQKAEAAARGILARMGR